MEHCIRVCACMCVHACVFAASVLYQRFYNITMSRLFVIVLSRACLTFILSLATLDETAR